MSGATRDDADGVELDARMLADLRQWRASERVSRELDAGKDAFLSREELDMLLRIADERDALRRQAADMPDETPRQRWEASRAPIAESFTPITARPEEIGTHGHIWPCSLFYIGNWHWTKTGGKPLAACSCRVGYSA